MNSDPYDSAAWRTFGMLDADEISTFDEARRDDPALHKISLEMDRLAAAIAASAATPIEPAAGLLEGIQKRIKLNPARRGGRWLAVSGWAAALAMALLLILGRGDKAGKPAETPPPLPLDSSSTPATTETKTTSAAAAERLTREVEALRENLERYQHRDRTLFTPIPGMALPIVMTMTPPGMVAGDYQITTLLADALRAATIVDEPLPEEDSLPLEKPADLQETPATPASAIPIYDSARDFGTLVISNLPDTAEGETYNLWVTTQTASEPVYVGSLPQNIATESASFDFSLGSTMILPSGFMLTRDPAGHPAPPTEANIALQGPPAPSQ